MTAATRASANRRASSAQRTRQRQRGADQRAEPAHVVAQQAVGVGAGRPLGLHLAVLAAITAVFFVLARRRLVQ